MSVDHGGDIYAAARATGRSVRRITDFSASINPLGPSQRALKAIASALPETVHYPDPACLALREALAQRHRLSIDHFAIGNGSSEFIHLMPFVFGFGAMLVIGPTFSEYARAMALRGGRVLHVNADRRERYRPPIEQAIRMIRGRKHRIDVVLLCNPNSPTGQCVNHDALRALVEAIGQCHGWAVIDETFVEYCEQQSLMPVLEGYPHLLIVRSFTKFFALPGLRVGYLAGHPMAVAKVRAAQPPWSVNTLAQAAALLSMNDRAYTRRSVRMMAQERPRLMEALTSIPGLAVYPSEANFLLAELSPPHSAADLTDALRQQGLLIRDCSTMMGMPERTIRIAVRTSAENRRLVAAVRRTLQPSGGR